MAQPNFDVQDPTQALEFGRQILAQAHTQGLLSDPDRVLAAAQTLQHMQEQEKIAIRLLVRAYDGFFEQERFVEAEQAMRCVLQLEQSTGASIVEQSGSLHNIAVTLLFQVRLEEAETLFRTALEWLEQGEGSAIRRAATLDYLGCVVRALRRLEEAEQALKTALVWTEQSKDWLLGRAITLHELGGVLCDLGRFEEAEQALRTAQCKEQGGDFLVNRGETLHDLGRVMHKMGRLEEAQKVFLEALEFKEKGSGVFDSLELSLASVAAVQHVLYRDTDGV
jgi:tetratricopeptide (TPR) repeat protein